MKRGRLRLISALLVLFSLSMSSLFAAAPITTNLLVSLDPKSSTISGTTAGASDSTTTTGTMQASGMYVSPNTYITFGDSTNQYIDYGNIGSTAGDISLEMWTNITTMHGNWNILASKWFNGTFGSDWHFGYNISKLRLCYNGLCPAAGSDTITRGTGWHHVAFTISQPANGTCPGTAGNNGTVTLYFDGVQVAQDVSTGACHPTSSDMLFVIGDKRGTASLGIDGTVGKFRFYTRALTSSDMNKIFRAEASTYGISAAPYNSVAPSFTGSFSKVGVLQTGANGSWLNSPTSYSYRWYRAATANGTYTAIAGATSSTYTPVTADASNYLKFEVTATNITGSTVDTSTATAIGLGEPNLNLSGVPILTSNKTLRNLSLNTGYAGKITFKSNGKRIPKCINLVANSGNSYTVTCPWMPAVIGFNSVVATFTSSDAGVNSGSTQVYTIFVQKRSGTR